MKPKLLSKIAWAICFLVAIVLCFKSLREPDLWWMYRTGEWMLANGTVTTSDPFSYTFAGTEWVNVKWLFEIIITLGKSILGVEGIFVFQALVAVGILYAVGQSSQLIYQHLAEDAPQGQKPFFGLIIAVLLLLFTIDYRMIGRPEMTSHLLTAVYLYLFWRYHYAPSKAIFALIPLQLFWTNMHEAFGTGMVLMVAYLGAHWVQYFYLKYQEKKPLLPKQLSIAVLAALAVIVVNPRGYKMWLHPFEIFSQLSSNQYTTELAPIWKVEYWQYQSYFNIFFFVVGVLFVLLAPFLFRKMVEKRKTVVVRNKKSKKKKKKVKTTHVPADIHWLEDWITKFGLGNLLLLALLAYLSTTAYRNIPFFAIAATPLLAVALEYLYQKANRPKWLRPVPLILGIGFYLTVATGYYHQWTGSRDQYGLQVLSSHNPYGAAQFIKDNNIEGKCFSDFLTSSYLLWSLQPSFKTYIDLRDLDIFTTAFYDDFAKTVAFPDVFEAKDDSLQFDYVVLFRPQFQRLQQHLVQSEAYDLVFVDPVACIYLKKNEQNRPLIQKYGFTENDNRDLFADLEQVPSSNTAYLLSKIFNPIYQPTDYSEVSQQAIAGGYYMSLGYTDLALKRAQKAVTQGEKELWKGYELFGNVYNSLAFSQETPDSLRQIYVGKALNAYNKAISIKPDYASALTGKASISMQQGDFTSAISILHEVIEIVPKNQTAIQYLSMSYKNLYFANQQNKGNAQKWLEYALQLDRLNPDNPTIMLDIGLAYCAIGDCPNATLYLNKVQEVPGLPAQEMKFGKKCLSDCSL